MPYVKKKNYLPIQIKLLLFDTSVNYLQNQMKTPRV